jgi:transcription termination factor Rho
VDTGNRADEVIYDEFKNTGNLELYLSRALVGKRLFPAIDVGASNTRREELLLHPDELERVWQLRRWLQAAPPAEALELLLKRLKETRSNAEFLLSLKGQ